MKMAGEWFFANLHTNGRITYRRSKSFRCCACSVDCHWRNLWREPLNRSPKEQAHDKFVSETFRQKDRGAKNNADKVYFFVQNLGLSHCLCAFTLLLSNIYRYGEFMNNLQSLLTTIDNFVWGPSTIDTACRYWCLFHVSFRATPV